jgi:uncharacterized protein YbjT (DUF2867 family)
MNTEASRVALVIGASGLTGAKLVRALLDTSAYTRVLALSRRPLPLSHARLANRVLRFEDMEAQLQGSQCHDAFCCLGTTLRQAGSQQAFRAVDQDLVLRFARLALQLGARQLAVVSSVSANAESKNFYLRVKGETERALAGLKAEGLHLMQPSLMLGSRRESRWQESLAKAAMMLARPLLVGDASRWRAIRAETVAAAMVTVALGGRRGVHRYEFAQMQRMARRQAS